MFSYRAFSLANGALVFVLFAILLIAPEQIVALFGMEQAVSASVLGRRAAMLFLGYGILSVSSSSAEHSQARQAILLGVGSAMLGLACMGLTEYLRERATWPVLLAMTAEWVFAAWAYGLFLKYRKEHQGEHSG